MHIIPVIDLQHGKAVLARKGVRAKYQAVKTKLCQSDHPADVVKAYLSVYPFETIYLADLNAIENNGNNLPVITRLNKEFPDINFWLDAAYPDNTQYSHDKIQPIVASESGISIDTNSFIQQNLSKLILSLDFSGKQLIGDSALLRKHDSWPEKIIIMSLHRVGSNQGPDIDLFKSIKSRAPNKQYYLAGGIRNIDDLEQLSSEGISGVLIASSLHSKVINSEMLIKLQR